MDTFTLNERLRNVGAKTCSLILYYYITIKLKRNRPIKKKTGHLSDPKTQPDLGGSSKYSHTHTHTHTLPTSVSIKIVQVGLQVFIL